jgi:ATP-binding protein involved in chromosome partitioning
MVMKALTQFLREVEWGTLDYLVIDLPPGTGDAQLTLVQSVPLSGAVIVTTPQDVALIDAKKAAAMFRKTEVPILGIVENMSRFVCPSCGHQESIFGSGGGSREAERLGVPFLGEIPLEPSIREGGDSGTPVVVSGPGSPAAEAFEKIVAAVRASLD